MVWRAKSVRAHTHSHAKSVIERAARAVCLRARGARLPRKPRATVAETVAARAVVATAGAAMVAATEAAVGSVAVETVAAATAAAD